MELSFCIWLAKKNKARTPAANCKLNDSSKDLCRFADFKCYTHPLEKSPFGIKHFITYVASYQSQHGRKKEFK